MSSRSVVWLIVVLAVAFVLSLGGRGGLLPGGEPRTVDVVQLVPEPDCEPLGRTCRALGAGMSLGVALPADARPMRGFPVQVNVAGEERGEPDAVSVEFLMQGMDMGVNRFRLEPQGPGAWGAQVTLPICTTGRSDWLVVVDADLGERRYRARFPARLE